MLHYVVKDSTGTIVYDGSDASEAILALIHAGSGASLSVSKDQSGVEVTGVTITATGV